MTPITPTYRIESEFVTMSAAILKPVTYTDGTGGLQAIENDPTSEHLGNIEHLTVNLRGHGWVTEPGHVWVRDYSEHSGLPAALEEAGIGKIVRRENIGDFHAPVACLQLTT